MNERNQPALPLESDEDKDLTSIAADSAHTTSTAVFASDPLQVSVGFAMALRLMGLGHQYRTSARAAKARRLNK
jgi:hypothetical protein